MESLNDIKAWLSQQLEIKGRAAATPKKKPGYRVLFNGPAGVDKMTTAQMLGKEFGKEVHRVDLSRIVSKYIGETEKNIAAIFKEAEGKDWILFFDEADALFGKRTTVKDAHDRYANQEINYLLQQLESYPGLAIIATNLKANIDDAFIRRFQTVVKFPKA
ncbi:MAG: ATP-binding protein [Flavisolibacter sp.]|nr:ATP-binding protein [Flavisolibacter sp.]